MTATGAKNGRVRNDFTATEERDLVEFLADYEPAARMGIFPYRELANKACGAKHSAESWLSRYKRFRSIYDVRIQGFILESSTHRDGDPDGALEPARKKPRRTVPSPDNEETAFGNLPISFNHFTKNNHTLLQHDQWIGLNLAINFLSEAHGVAPEVAYATWKRTHNLSLTDARLRETAASQQARRSRSPDVTAESAPSTSKRKRAASSDDAADEEVFVASLQTPTPKKRTRARKQYSEMDIVPTSEPGEAELSSLGSRPIAIALRRRKQDPEGLETPLLSPLSEASPLISDAHPSVHADDSDDESDSDSETSKQPQFYRSGTISPGQQSDLEDLKEPTAEGDSESESESGSEPEAPHPARQPRPADDAEDESDSASDHETSVQLRSPVQRPEESGSESSSTGSEGLYPIPEAGPSIDAGDSVEEEKESGSESENESKPSLHQPTTDHRFSQSHRKDDTQADADDSDVEDGGSSGKRVDQDEDSQTEDESCSEKSASQRSRSGRSESRENGEDDEEDSYIKTQVSLFG
ncbi:hypothetical protein B0H14DRAFT_2874942 [Mycena olivaceomarginata]|nr:hypothetical protein B0H14DRAFT_2874942 [Mycena olivaceomarginata]